MARENDTADLPRFLRLLWSRRLTGGRALRMIAVLTIGITLAGGTLVWLIDRNEFSSFGDGIWWALQTVTTVGYGDVVPSDTDGRVIGAILMLQGIGLITVVAAAITTTLLEQMRERRGGAEAQLERIERRLAAIERALAPQDAGEPDDPEVE
jgi:voltage-gated potassium channel